MTTLVMLEEILSAANARRLFDAASNKSKREVEYLVACEKNPLPRPVEAISPLGIGPVSGISDAGEPPDPLREFAAWAARKTAEIPVKGGGGLFATPPSDAPPEPELLAGEMHPIGEDRYRVRMTVDGEFIELLEKAQAILSHPVPDRNMVEVLRRGLRKIVEQHERKMNPKRPVAKKQKSAAGVDKSSANSGKSEQASRAPSGNSYIPSPVRQAVWARDGGRCSWPKPGGGVCGSTHKLQFDHVKPRAKGGASSEENTRLLCAAHNLQHARGCFGEQWMARFTARDFSREKSVEGPQREAARAG